MMFNVALLVAILATASAFMPTNVLRSSRTQLAMKSNDFQKAIAASMIGASLFLGGSVKAEVDYQGIAYLGGGDKIDLNNANIRAYLKVPGFYPSIASKIVVNGPFKTVADVYNIPGLTSVQKDIIKKSESRFLALDVKPEYEIDKINNGISLLAFDCRYFINLYN